MKVPTAFDPPERSSGFTVASTAEMLAALPEGLMLADGASPADRRVTDILGLYRAVFLNSTDPIAIIDGEGRYLEQNAAHQRLLGYSAEELRGKSPALHMGENTFGAVAMELASVGIVNREVVSTTKSGESRTIDLSAFAVRDRTGRAVCYVGITRDVTEERRAAQELHQRFEELQVLYQMTEALSQARALEDIYEQAIDALQRAVHADRAAILEFDDDHVMRFRAWRRLSGSYRSSVEGHSPWTAETTDASPVTIADVATDESLGQLHQVVTSEGIRALAFIPLTEGERLLGKFMLYFDAPHAWTDAELRLATTVARHVAFAIRRHLREQELRDANYAKSTFLATMSHELRTPLNAIAGYTDLLDADVHGQLTQAQRDAVWRVQANQRHLLRLIDDVLDFAKIESGRLQLEITDMPVQETLDGTRLLIEPQLRARELAFEFVPGDPAVTCRGDRGKVQQVLANLLANSCKFTPPGGRVTVSWELSDDDVRISVRDTGQGIPENKLESIFEPFVQLQTGFRRRVEGTGLGLAISRELARGMDGDVLVSSAPGGGSTFTLVLPRH